jgi:hypothetical protein
MKFSFISHTHEPHKQQTFLALQHEIFNYKSNFPSTHIPIPQAAHNLVNSNELLRQHIKPHLAEPQFSLIAEPNPLKSNQMSNLVSYLNELVSDQVRARSCIPLTPELQKFYDELMRREKSDDNERDKKSVDDFLMTRRKFKRNAVSRNQILINRR